ncbi:MAG: hypothetical protein WC389_16145 [Lutibacter sp.]|jgi:hypothetical protein
MAKTKLDKMFYTQFVSYLNSMGIDYTEKTDGVTKLLDTRLWIGFRNIKDAEYEEMRELIRKELEKVIKNNN